MPNFTARPTAGTGTVVWTDPSTVAAPSRINPTVGRPHLYYQITVDTQVTVKATVGGTEGPLDGALGGELFTMAFIEWPDAGLVSIVSPGGQSSVGAFTPLKQGHHLLRVRRTNGGSVYLLFHAVEP